MCSYLKGYPVSIFVNLSEDEIEKFKCTKWLAINFNRTFGILFNYTRIYIYTYIYCDQVTIN